MIDNMHAAHGLVSQYMDHQAALNKQYYDKNVRLTEYQINDKVLVYNPKKVKGKYPKWSKTYGNESVITKRINDITYAIVNRRTGRQSVVHINKLRLIPQPAAAAAPASTSQQ